MYIFLLFIFLLVSIALIGMVMLQHGKCADMGSSLGLVASFRSSVSGDFIARITAIIATLFFVISLILGNLTANKSVTGSKLENIGELVDKPAVLSTVPVVPTSDVPH
ncbi:Protein-export membrane protein SecG [Arsenophonus endosymbiont of Aleurodicus dispersus]|uniref:preprotein translocase subunit SecG n=1 Tax=Arsenophonus endosymbiont of Aleurodicus dispersus TaxID=235559 RepID=UPI000EAC1F00|nr:preprotein translocase subunit SecG [Arsenophonus endosymbiont of Aleurodicus dispersus]VAY02186.1 Protein-export membrane protein SecG [Arsenophonus endosymbiont of Aleurodicus dispersus]